MALKKEKPFFPEEKRDEFQKALRSGKSITTAFKGIDVQKLRRNIGGIVLDELNVAPVFTQRTIELKKNRIDRGTITLKVYRPIGGGRIHLYDSDSDRP